MAKEFSIDDFLKSYNEKYGRAMSALAGDESSAEEMESLGAPEFDGEEGVGESEQA